MLEMRPPDFLVKLIVKLLGMMGICRNSTLPTLICPQCLLNEMNLGAPICDGCKEHILYLPPT